MSDSVQSHCFARGLYHEGFRLSVGEKCPHLTVTRFCQPVGGKMSAPHYNEVPYAGGLTVIKPQQKFHLNIARALESFSYVTGGGMSVLHCNEVPYAGGLNVIITYWTTTENLKH